MRDYTSFLQENARWLVGGFLLCFFSSFGQTFFISLSGGQIRAEYGLTNGEFGSLYMAATLLSALTLTQVGRIVDHFSVAKTALIVMPLLAIACVFMSVSTSIILLFVTIYLLRLFGQGMMTHTAITAMGRWYTGHRGRAVSLTTLGHQGGEALLPIMLVFLLGFVSWRTGWLIAAGILIFGALPLIYALMRVNREPRATDMPSKRSAAKDWTRGEVLRDPLFWLMLLGVLAPAFIGTTMFFHQAYLVELRGWSPQVFASAFIVMAMMTICFALLCGFLVDKFGAPAVLPYELIPLALACFALAYVPQEFGIFIFMALVGMSYGMGSTLFGALWPEVYGTKHLGGVRSITMAAMVFASAMGPGVSGILIDLGVSYFTQFAYMGFYCVAASFILLFVSRKLKTRAL